MRGPKLLTIPLVTLLLGAAPAAGEEVTRESYLEAVEPICTANTEANKRIFTGVRAEVSRGELKPAAVQFERAAKALTGTVSRLRAVPQPTADQARLAKWLDAVYAEVPLFRQVAAELRGDKKAAAFKLVVKLTHQASIANSIVIPLQFDSCRLEPSRFT